MADTNFPDEWLARSLEGVLSPELLVELRTKAQPGQTLWEALVAQKVVNDDQILTALSTRFRLKLADVKDVDPGIKEKVPEQLARRYHVLPLRITDSFLEAILARSSDSHIEPEEGGVAVRYRIDGVLRQQMKIPRQAGLPLISRIKIMSSLDIADRLRPQDGRARVAVNGQPIDLRVSTLPAALGEKVVIRILDSRATVKSLDSLGLNANEVEAIKRLG